MPHEMHEDNRRVWNISARAGYGQVDTTRDWRACHADAARFFAPQELAWLKDVAGARACVLGSGDNLAVFALAGMGARVTSVDISEEQLRVAAGRADEVGARIEFVRADVTDLGVLATGTFDLVYTGGHVAVWVSDLNAYYREAVRILKPGGLFVVNEYHPFRRLWKQERGGLRLEAGYLERGPFHYDRADLPGVEPGELTSHEFHWTVGEFVRAVRDAPARLLDVDEFGDDAESWEEADLAGLPRCLMIVGRKEGDTC